MCLIHMYIYMYIMILWWWDVMRIWWWLHSTTGSYGRPVIELTYGETLIHSTEVVWEILARKEWLSCLHDASPMFDIPESTPMWVPYILFSEFQGYKNLYVLCFQIYTYYKRTLVVSNLVLARWGSENVFDHPKILKEI